MHKQVAEIVERHRRHHRQTENGMPWGRRKLAYEIGHHKEGFYVLEVITGSGELMKEIDRRLKVTEGLLRHLIVRVDESSIKAERCRSQAHRGIAAAAAWRVACRPIVSRVKVRRVRMKTIQAT
jgi:ribosomal protein S6